MTAPQRAIPAHDGATRVKAQEMFALVKPSRVAGAVRVPASKSVTHRAFLMAAQASQPAAVVTPLLAGDTESTLAGLHALGARFEIAPNRKAVRFVPASLRPPTHAIECGNSGTTLRLLAATAARLPAPITLTGDASLRSRSSKVLLEALRGLGARVHDAGDGRAPFTVHGPTGAGSIQLPSRSSSQFASALLLSLPFQAGESTLHMMPPVASAPYLDVTLDIARRAGLRIEREGWSFRIPGGQVPHFDALEVDGDWSAAAFPLVAAAITGGEVEVLGLDVRSPQGDRAIVGHLASFGCKVVAAENGIEFSPATRLESPGSIDVSATPDLFPALAVLAASSRGTTTFTGGAALRNKESDRIKTMAVGLAKMGIKVEERPDGLVVHAGALRAAEISTAGDHRIHMAFAVAGLAAAGTTRVDGADAADVSYPGFHGMLRTLGARVEVVAG
jgi:3-phosphoshikimate 1-carboxyvinyltransferase